MSISVEVLVAVGAAAFVLLGVVMIVAALRVIAMEGRLGVLERRLGRQEEASKKADHDLGDLRLQVAEMKGDLRAVGASMATMNHGVGRIESFLMDAAAKRVAGVDDGQRGGQ